MSTKRRSWSVDQKLQLIQEADQYGITETIRKYNVAQSLFHRWKRSLTKMGYQVCNISTTRLIRKSSNYRLKMNA